MKKVIDMSAQEAKKYFLKSTSYFSMNLPEYFDFSDLLNDVELKINGNKLNNLWNNKPEIYDNINYKFNQNKDGKYAWRMFQLIHPAIYIDIVNTITEAQSILIRKIATQIFFSNLNPILQQIIIYFSKTSHKNSPLKIKIIPIQKTKFLQTKRKSR